MITVLLIITDSGVQQPGHLRYKVIQVAGTKHDEYIEGAALDKTEHIVLTDELFLNARTQTVVDDLRGYPLYRLFAGRVYLGQYYLVEQAQGIGEVTVEVSCTSI